MQIIVADEIGPRCSGLCELLLDAVGSGASVGFLCPMRETEARAYWDEVSQLLESGSRKLLIAIVDGVVAGSVQLDLPVKPNAQHRAEVIKLFVHRTFRKQGIGRALMYSVEQEAKKLGRTLLVLDTREDDDAERLYTSTGWIKCGEIPGYALGSDGNLHGTVFFYKQL